MNHFHYLHGALHAENVAVEHIAQHVGSPCYIYSRATLERHWHAFDQSLAGYPHLICYAVKANSNIAVLNLLARLGSGFDIVSGGELYRVLQAQGDPGKVVFSGVGKSSEDIRYALRQGIHCFNVESAPELERIATIAAELGLRAPIALRVNPDVDAGTHPYISTGLKENKFGIDIEQALDIYRRAAAMASIRIIGIACHIGSQLTEVTPFLDALERVLALVERLGEAGITLQHIDLGGGLGVTYRDEQPPLPAEYSQAIRQRLEGSQLAIHLEPGRAIAANAGILVTRVEYLKLTEHKNFAVVDAAMNDLLRPALYQAWQDIVPVIPRDSGVERDFDVVGPVCETGDFLGKQRRLRIQAGDLLAVRSAGAYGFTMSSNYNSRPRAAEVLVDGGRFHVVRRRETLADLVRGEQVLPGD